MLVPFRQGIVNSQKQGLAPGFLSVQAGNITLLADNTPLIMCFAHGASDYLISVDSTKANAWTGFGTSSYPTGVSYWLYIDVDPATGLITYGQVPTTQTNASKAPTNPLPNQHWYDMNSSKMKVWTGNTWQVRIRLFVAEFTNSSTISYIPYGTQVGKSTSVNAGRIAFDSYSKPIRKSTGEFFTTEDSIYVNGIVSAPNSYETRRIAVTALEPIPARSIVALAQFDKVVVARYEDTGTRVLGFANNAMAVGQTEEIVLSGVIENTAWNFSTVNDNIWVELGQPVVVSPFTVTSGRGIQQPIGKVIAPQKIRFNPPNFHIPTVAGTPTAGPTNIWITTIDTSNAANLLSYGTYDTHKFTGNTVSSTAILPPSAPHRMKLTPGYYTFTFNGVLSADFIGNPRTTIVVSNAPTAWPMLPAQGWTSQNTGGVSDTETGLNEVVESVTYTTTLLVVDEVEFAIQNTLNPNTLVRTSVAGTLIIKQLNVTI
jgi:hypothetical protein